ncbi:ribbon-helix-helix protein, CopG family [Escherichia coli]|uniref:CopG family ribbon-helix-helix protein n=1 Tax=Escherichia coli TaxID=562 RepID=UPI001BFE36AD|nr:ribbon-helix-helix protein, CopG family [Escherichia coli]
MAQVNMSLRIDAELKDAFMAARLERSQSWIIKQAILYDFLMPPNKPIVAG